MNYSPFTILPFSEANLALALSNKLFSPELVKNKAHFIYLLDHLSSSNDGIDAKTILIENNYVSKSYISDYSDYYSKCFREYERLTKRIHFFSNDFTFENFEKSLKENNDCIIWDSYLGFVVAKPLPDAIIGPTLLKTFNRTESEKRNFTVTKNYSIHLFGRTLELDSLIYQEQDTILSACATTALWSAFQKASEMFQSLQPSPSEITKMAGNLFFNSGRTFPNHGLDFYQICKAIEGVGLVSELRNKKFELGNIKYLKSFVYGYLKIGLPVLLGINIKNVGLHLITLTGFKEKEISRPLDSNLSLVAERIERFYAHDDQVGPFCRIGFSGNKIITSWWQGDIDNKLEAEPSAIFVPLYPKIRITFEEVYIKINSLDKFFFIIKISGTEIVWDIFLDFSNNFKKEIQSNFELEENYKLKIILNQMPRFIWRGKAFVKDQIVMELIFDATDISRGFFCSQIIFYDVNFKDALKSIFTLETFKDKFIEILDKNYFELFILELDK